MDAQQLKVAVVGTGAWGEQHARLFAQRQDTTLCAVVGRDPGRTEARAHAYGATPYTDVDAMLATEQPDLVTVCLPNEAHFAPTMHLLGTGVALLVEKPLVFDLTEADALLAAASERGTFFAINLNHRYAEPVQLAHRAIADGTLGDVVFVTWRFGGEPNWGTSPHGNLIETQVHGLDMIEHLCGPITSVMAQMYDGTRPGTFTTVAVAFELAGGGVGTLLGTYDSSYAYPDTHRLEVNGTLGRVVVEDTCGGSACRSRVTRPPGCGRPGTSTTRRAASTGRSTGTSTPCWRPCAPGRRRPCTRGPDGAPWSWRTRSSARPSRACGS